MDIKSSYAAQASQIGYIPDDKRQKRRKRARGHGFSWSSYWMTRGVVPGADATLITSEINTALTNFRSVRITEAGTYDIDGTLWIPSNTTLTFVSGCTLRKKTGASFAHMIANKGIQTLTRNNGIQLNGNGLILDVNGVELTDLSYRMRGQLNFFKVDGLIVDHIESTTTTEDAQFMYHFADVNTFLISNISHTGLKDALHFSSLCHDGAITDIYTDTEDDAFAFIVCDYPDIMACVGDIYNITVSRWVDEDHVYAGELGRIMHGSWENWTNGHSYSKTDLCVNAGRTYLKTGASGTAAASNAPTHATGAVTGADGIEWTFLQNGTATHGNVYNITFTDCDFTGNYRGINCEQTNDDTLRSTYPGTGGNGYIENLVIDNCRINYTDISDFVNSGCFIKSIYFRNINQVFGNDSVNLFIQANPGASVPDGGKCENVYYEHCNLTFGATSLLFSKPLDGIVENIFLDGNAIILNGQILLNVYQPAAGQHTDITLTNNTITGMLALLEEGHSNSIDIVSSGNTFIDHQRIINRTSGGAGAITFTSDGDTFEDPIQSLLFGATGLGLQIDITNSIGSVTKSKIANTFVDILNCSLLTLGAELIDQANWFKPAWWDEQKTGCLESGGTMTFDGTSQYPSKWNFLDITLEYYLVRVSALVTSGTYWGCWDGETAPPDISVSQTRSYIMFKNVNRRSLTLRSQSFVGSATAMSLRKIS